ncbi:MAG: response regulator [Polyangiaceae bacterium]
MGKGRIVVIEGDDWIARLLEDGLRTAGYDVDLASDAADGVRRACAARPSLVISATALVDHDGYWVTRSLRAHASDVSRVPLLLIGNADDDRAPRLALEGGADAYLSKPFRVEEVVAQVAALLEMEKRLRAAQKAPPAEKPAAPSPPAPPAPAAVVPAATAAAPPGEALRGSIEQMSVGTVLTMLELERRTGQLKVTSGSAEATIELIGGFAVSSTLRGVATPLLATTRELLNWPKGVVSFHVGKDAPVPDKKRPIGALLMEAVQLNAQGGPTPPPAAPRVANKTTSSLSSKTSPKPSKQ